MIKKIFEIEAIGLKGKLKEGKIVLTIDPIYFSDQKKEQEAVLLTAYQELSDYLEFLESKNETKKSSTSSIINLNNITIGKEIITEGACNGQTFNDAYKKEGRRAIEYLEEKGCEDMRQKAIIFLETIEREVQDAI